MRRKFTFLGIFILFSCPFIFLLPVYIYPQCRPFFLKDEKGRIINPITGENAHQPYSTRQTCGTCHPYETITKGYHFQQGADFLDENFGGDQRPWVLSNGMFGKW